MFTPLSLGSWAGVSNKHVRSAPSDFARRMNITPFKQLSLKADTFKSCRHAKLSNSLLANAHLPVISVEHMLSQSEVVTGTGEAWAEGTGVWTGAAEGFIAGAVTGTGAAEGDSVDELDEMSYGSVKLGFPLVVSTVLAKLASARSSMALAQAPLRSSFCKQAKAIALSFVSSHCVLITSAHLTLQWLAASGVALSSAIRAANAVLQAVDNSEKFTRRQPKASDLSSALALHSLPASVLQVSNHPCDTVGVAVGVGGSCVSSGVLVTVVAGVVARAGSPVAKGLAVEEEGVPQVEENELDEVKLDGIC
mmetsp:Transcript_39245/g.77168  ORF Transcript_39245/g.77168 Transcript_39245/m.77168 type:complete len:308 (-) Transcript_39245:84-1007(-)